MQRQSTSRWKLSVIKSKTPLISDGVKNVKTEQGEIIQRERTWRREPSPRTMNNPRESTQLVLNTTRANVLWKL